MRVDALIDSLADERPSRVALAFGQRSWTFAALRVELDRRAGALARAGLHERDLAITAEPQTDDLILTFLACCRVGVVLCSLSPLLTPHETAALIQVARPAVAFTADGSNASSVGAPRALPIALPGDGGVFPPTTGGNGAPAVIRPTSGTTATVPKLVVMPHRQLTWRLAARAWWETADDVFYLPMRNHFAVVDVCNVLCSGATLVVSHATSPNQIESDLSEHRATVVLTVPALLGVLNGSRHAPPRGIQLKAIRTSAAQLPLDLRRATESRYGVPVVQQYGSTESGFVFATAANGTPPESVGRPMPGVLVQVVDEAGQPVQPGEVGELLIQAPGMMLGYLNEPSATADVLQDGWLRTGDLARQDAKGFFTLHGRRDGRITASGFKVLPEEVEAVLATHPGVLEVAVTSDADPVRGETLRAVIVPSDGERATSAELARFCRERLASYKVPRRFDFVAVLPRTPLGKVKRAEL